MTSGVKLPESALGRRTAWIVGLMTAGGAEADKASVEEAFSDEFLAKVPTEALVGMLAGLREMGEENPPSEFVELTPVTGRLLLGRDGEGMRTRFGIAVEEAEPNRITGLAFEAVFDNAEGAIAVSWAKLDHSSPVAVGNGVAGAPDRDTTAALEKLIATAIDEFKFVGLAVSVAGPEGLEWFRGYGPARIAEDGSAEQAVQPTSVFRIGSVSKTMTAIGVAQLVAAGRLAYDEPINNHLKHYRIEPFERSAPATVRHLLTHSSGLDPRPGLDIGVKVGQPIPDLSDFYRSGLQASRPVGGKMVYSNDAFGTPGQLIADVSGQTFADYMNASLFGPLAMTSTSYLREPEFVDRLVTAFNVDGDEVTETVDMEIVPAGAGSVFSTAEDMSRYAAALITRSIPGLTAEQLEDLWAVHGDVGELPEGGPRMHLGLAFIVHDVDGHRIPWHNGGWAGAATSFWAAADDGFAVTLTANSFNLAQSPGLDALGKKLTRCLLGLPTDQA